jgi:hypothetical protein
MTGRHPLANTVSAPAAGSHDHQLSFRHRDGRLRAAL